MEPQYDSIPEALAAAIREVAQKVTPEQGVTLTFSPDEALEVAGDIERLVAERDDAQAALEGLREAARALVAALEEEDGDALDYCDIQGCWRPALSTDGAHAACDDHRSSLAAGCAEDFSYATALRTLRKLLEQAPPSPPEVPVSTPDQIQKFLEFTASVKNGARRDTCLSWLKARGLSRVKSEELIETLLETGAIVPQDFVVAGETITRYLPPSGSVEPAPLPTSDAPPEEPAAVIDAAAMVEEALPLEEPVAVAKERPELPTVTPGKRGKVRLPTMEEIEHRVARIERDEAREQLDTTRCEAHGLRQQLQEVSAERDEARARCAAWEQEADHAYRQLCRAADLEEGCPLSSILERVRLLVAAAKAYAEPAPPPQAPAPSPRSLFGGLAPEARRTVADVLGELAAHLRQEPTPSGKIGWGLDRLSTNARTVLDILPRGEEPSITRKEIKSRSGLDNTNSVSTALRTLERLGLASSPSWGFWRAT